MLTPDQVHPFLHNDDPIVWRHALDYFRESSTVGPFTADDLWPLIDRYGGTLDALSAASALDAAPQTEASLQRLLLAIEQPHSESFDIHYQRAIRDMPFDLLVSHRDAVLGCSKLLGHVRDHLNLRLQIADDPTAVLWQRLMDHGRALGDQYANAFSYSESDALIEALARRGEEAGELALSMLDDEAAAEDWREIFAVKVLGHARFQPAIAPLVEKFAIDADVLREEVSRALVRIGSPEVVRQIAVFYPGKEWHVRLYTWAPLEHIKLPDSQVAILEMLKTEDDPGLRANLLVGLCMLGSLAGLEMAREEIDQDPDDPELMDLCEHLLATALMNGVNLPEAEEWRRRIDLRDRRFAKKLADADIFVEPYRKAWLKNGISSPPIEHSRRSALEAIDEMSPPDDGLPPIRRDTTKIGRNDPCPCGSGKKYKKCCLDK